jgi:hypothetical protein
VVTVTAGVASKGIDAEMQVAGRIDGVVTASDTSLPLAGAQVCASRAAGRESFFSCGFTNAAGEYAISRLATGSYEVRFWPGFEDASYLGQYYSDKPTRKLADVISVAAGSTTHGIGAALHPGGKIAGTVIDADTEAAIQGVEVCALKPGVEFASQAGCDQTGAGGEYTIEGIATGSYRVQFSPPFYSHLNYLGQYYEGKPSEGESDPVEVVAGSTMSGIDAEMEVGGRITGEAIDAVSKDPAPAVAACAVGSGGEFEHCGYTNSSGEYAIVGLPTGSYEIRFAPGQEFAPGGEPANYGYAPQYYDGKASRAEAEPVGVTVGSTTPNVDVEMGEGGGISGTVTDAGSEAPMRYVEVCVYTAPAFEYASCAGTGSSGEYLIEGLASGDYYVGFRARGEGPEESANYLTQYYSGGSLQSEADPVAVSAGAMAAGIDAELQPGGQIEGRVTVALGGASLQSAEVCALEASGEEIVDCAETDVNGEYAIGGLRTGPYRVQFSAGYYDEEEGDFVEEFATQYYSGAASAGLAKLIAVTEGAVTGPIDAKMAPPGAGGGGGEGAGGSSGDGGAAASPGSITLPGVGNPPLRPKPPKCKKGQKRKAVHGKARCVKIKHHHKRGGRSR